MNNQYSIEQQARLFRLGTCVKDNMLLLQEASERQVPNFHRMANMLAKERVQFKIEVHDEKNWHESRIVIPLPVFQQQANL